jgi:hypothetical protein
MNQLKTHLMKQFLIFCYFTILTVTSFAQLTAVTSNGDEVILNADGTWKYLNDSLQHPVSIDTNNIRMSRPVGATFIVKSSKLNCGVYIDPKKWSFTKNKPDETSEFQFTLKGMDAYGMIISEKMEIPLPTLRNIALKNAKSVAPDMMIIKEEYRKVNDNTVLLIQMNGTINGIKITYFGYYFSSTEGSVQLVTYTATKLFIEYKNVMEDFLNGFVTLKK